MKVDLEPLELNALELAWERFIKQPNYYPNDADLQLLKKLRKLNQERLLTTKVQSQQDS